MSSVIKSKFVIHSNNQQHIVQFHRSEDIGGYHPPRGSINFLATVDSG